MKAFRIRAVEWGNSGDCFSRLDLFHDGHRVEFRGDAYWQWSESPNRDNGNGFCWSQALHDALEGWHSCVLHTGDDVFVLEKHPDFGRVQALWDAALEGR